MRTLLPGLLHRAERLVPARLRRGLKAIAPGAIAAAQRTALRFTPNEAAEATIVDGPLRGRRFACRLRYEADYIYGTHEPAVTAWLTRCLRPSDTMFDVGAHAGYTALIAAALVGPLGRVVAFEPSGRNRELISRNLALNPDLASRIHLEAVAISNQNGVARFGGSETTGHLGGGDTTVTTVSLDSVIADGGPVPTIVKMDIEGGETLALAGMRELLRTHRPVLILELHDAAAHRRFQEVLDEHSYSVLSEDGATALARWTGRTQLYLATPK